MSFAVTWMQLEIIALRDVNQKEKDGTNEQIYKTETDLWT